VDRNALLQWIRLGIQSISAALSAAVNWDLTLASMNETDTHIAGLSLAYTDFVYTDLKYINCSVHLLNYLLLRRTFNPLKIVD